MLETTWSATSIRLQASDTPLLSLLVFCLLLALSFGSLLALCHNACVPLLFACLPDSHDIATPPPPITLLLVSLVGLASPSAYLGALVESCYLFI